MALNGQIFRITVGAISALFLLILVSVTGPDKPIDVDVSTESTPQVTKIGFIGDSITESQTAVDREIYLLGDSYKAVNKAVSGSTTAGWLPGGDYFTSALDAFQSQDVKVVSIMLGTNDSKDSLEVSGIEYRLHLKTIVEALLATGTITKVVLNYPPYLVPERPGLWSDQSLTRLESYMKQIDSLVNGTTILQGDTLSYSYFNMHPEELKDGVHPNNQGYATLGALWATSYLKLLTEPEAQATSTPETKPAPSSQSHPNIDNNYFM